MWWALTCPKRRISTGAYFLMNIDANRSTRVVMVPHVGLSDIRVK